VTRNRKKNEMSIVCNKANNIASGYFIIILLSILSFIGFIVVNRIAMDADDFVPSFFNSTDLIVYAFALCIFAFVFFASCAFVSKIPAKYTAIISNKVLPFWLQIGCIVIFMVVLAGLILHYLFVVEPSEIMRVGARTNYTTIFYWRQLPVVIVCMYTLICIFYNFYMQYTGIDTNNKLLFITYFAVIILGFLHCLYLRIPDFYHAAAYYDSVYNCYWGVPFTQDNMGVYGHYGIFYALLLHLFNGNAFTMFYIHAAFAAIAVAACVYTIHNIIQKNSIRIISALSSVMCISVLGRYTHWQRNPLRILFPMLLIAYATYMYKHNKFSYKFILLAYVIAGLGLVWNGETGIACVVAFTAAMIVYLWQKYKWYEKAMLFNYVKLIFCVCVSILAALGLINIYNLLSGNIIFLGIKDLLYPLLDDEYMDSRIDIYHLMLGNQPWIYMLIVWAFALLYALFNTKLINVTTDKYKFFDEKASVCACISVMALICFTCYATSAVYIAMEVCGYYACILTGFFADKYGNNLQKIIKKRMSFTELCQNSLGIASITILSIVAAQIVFTVPLMLYKNQNKFPVWDTGYIIEQSAGLEKIAPENAQILGTGVSWLKLQLGRDSQFYYRDIPTGFWGGLDENWQKQIISDSQLCDYVAFYAGNKVDRQLMKAFVVAAPEFQLISSNKLGGIDFYLYSKLKKYSCYFLAGSLPNSGDVEIKSNNINLFFGANQYGPYTDLERGEYIVTIKGENLTAATYDVYCNGEYAVNITEIARNDNEIKYSFTLDKPANVEFRTFNNSDETVVLYGIELNASLE